jgi:hypothetical protein
MTTLRPLVLLSALLLLTSPLTAQRGGGGGGFGGGGGGNNNLASALWGLPDVRSGFYICRLAYTQVAQDPSGSGWAIEYPRADINFLTRITQLTTTKIAYWRDGRSNGKGHTVVRATDPEIFSCPYVVMASPGTAGFSPEEVVALRTYLLKGGFIWADDFWGNGPWNHWVNQIVGPYGVFPGRQIREIDITHPLFSVLYVIPEVPQIPSLNNFQRGGLTQERPGAEYARASTHGIFDDDGRLMVFMTHNTDIADGFEREADLPDYFEYFAARAYAMGVNIAIWVMTR